MKEKTDEFKSRHHYLLLEIPAFFTLFERTKCCNIGTTDVWI